MWLEGCKTAGYDLFQNPGLFQKGIGREQVLTQEACEMDPGRNYSLEEDFLLGSFAEQLQFLVHQFEAFAGFLQHFLHKG
jgi:hypothetical protein